MFLTLIGTKIGNFPTGIDEEFANAFSNLFSTKCAFRHVRHPQGQNISEILFLSFSTSVLHDVRHRSDELQFLFLKALTYRQLE